MTGEMGERKSSAMRKRREFVSQRNRQDDGREENFFSYYVVFELVALTVRVLRGSESCLSRRFKRDKRVRSAKQDKERAKALGAVSTSTHED